MDPLDHYIYHGWKEGRTPSSKFDGEYYLDRYPDVKASKMNPLVHYVPVSYTHLRNMRLGLHCCMQKMGAKMLLKNLFMKF